MTGYVFVSYSRADRAYVQALGGHLRDAGIRLWFDHQLSTDGALDRVIEQTIDHCVAVIAVLSPDAAVSESVNRELAYAIDRGKTVMALELAPAAVPAAVAGLTREDVSGGRMPGPATMARLAAMVVYEPGAVDPAPAAATPTSAPTTPPPVVVPPPAAPPAPPPPVAVPATPVAPTRPPRGGTFRLLVRVVGVLALLAGLVWTLQGLGVLGGSVMSGQRQWAVIGPIVGLIGLVLLLVRRRRSS